jgi:adenylate cyclase
MKSSLAFLRQHVLPPAVCFALAAALTPTGLVQRFEDVTFDLRTQWRMKLAPRCPSGAVLLLAVDEDSLKGIGRWPWSRDVHGNLLLLASKVPPSVMAWDFLFTEPTPEDAHLLKGVTSSGTAVVLGAMRTPDDEGVRFDDPAFTGSRLQPLPRVDGDRSRLYTSRNALLPASALAEVAHLAFVDTPADRDGSRRRVPLVVRIGDQVYPTLSLKSILLHDRVRPEQVRVRLGDAIYLETESERRRIPINAAGEFLINYRYALSESQVFSYFRAYDELMARFVRKEAGPLPPLRGRVVLVGQTADALSDIGPTPMSEMTPLVLVHANAIENILDADYAQRVRPLPVWLGALALGVIGSAWLGQRKLRELAMFSLGVPLAYVLAAVVAWNEGSFLLPLVGPVLGFAALQGTLITRRVLLEQRAKEQIKGAFGAYLAPALVERLAASGKMPQLGGHEEEITAYFSDIQSFSTFSEMLPPPRLVELMNEYLTACTDIVQEEGGTLDKYIGDAVVAMFGAPIALPDHALRGCVAALRVQARLGELRAKWKSEGERWPEIVWKMQSRIGLNSGLCTVGNMGSRSRFNYTMMGDNVNLAARMESGAKQWGVYAMCAEATKLACEQHDGERVVFRALGRIQVVGREHAVPIFELVGLRENVTAAMRECVAVFEAGLERYHARDWAGAGECFRASAALEWHQPGKIPGVKDNPSLVYQRICARYRESPPGADWSGVYKMTEK